MSVSTHYHHKPGAWRLGFRAKHFVQVLSLMCVFVVTSAQAKILHEERSLYSRIIIKQTGSQVCLQFNVRNEQRNQSCIDRRKPKAMVFSYTQMSMAALLFTPQPQNILVIGLGGGTLPTAFNELYPEAVVDTVEIDPAVVKVANEYFAFSANDKLNVHTLDARVWTKRALRKDRRYDIIVLDAFNGEYIPEHLMTREYLTETQSLLTPTGTLVANTFSMSQLYDHESATYAHVFGSFINFRTPASGNRLVVVPGEQLDGSALSSRAKALSPRLRAYSVPIERFAELINKQRQQPPDWQQNVRLLTDQYAPANLLQGR